MTINSTCIAVYKAQGRVPADVARNFVKNYFTTPILKKTIVADPTYVERADFFANLYESIAEYDPAQQQLCTWCKGDDVTLLNKVNQKMNDVLVAVGYYDEEYAMVRDFLDSQVLQKSVAEYLPPNVSFAKYMFHVSDSPANYKDVDVQGLTRGLVTSYLAFRDCYPTEVYFDKDASQSSAYPSYDGKSDVISLRISGDPELDIRTGFHEAQHLALYDLVRGYRMGHVTRRDPDYPAARIFAANAIGYIGPGTPIGDKFYPSQPLELDTEHVERTFQKLLGYAL